MTTETKKRIRAYKRMLPELRERVVAVALLLAMSVSMLGTASYAWITLSRAPEVTGMQTTVAANGNLEIALAHGSASEAAAAPGESAVGDSSAAQGIVASNVTWGNLVNVSDPKYGLNHIALRPALLSSRALTVTPLEGASYGQDGRVISTTDKYYYASWKSYGSESRFASGDDSEYGVRAIVSTIQENVEGQNTVKAYLDAADIAYSSAVTIYNGMVTGQTKLPNKDGGSTSNTCITTLQNIVAVFAQDKLNEMGLGNGKGTSTSISKYMFNFWQMLELMRDSLDKEAEALLNLANAQAYLHQTNNNLTVHEKNFESMAQLKSYSDTVLLNTYGVKLVTLRQHLSDYEKLRQAIEDKICVIEDAEGNKTYKSLYEIAQECSSPNDPSIPTYTWDNVNAAILKLVDINTTTIGGYPVSELAEHYESVLGGGEKAVVIKDGLLKNVENRCIPSGSRMNASVSVKVTAFSVIPYTVSGRVTTTAGQDKDDKIEADPDREEDIEASGGAVTGGGKAVGKETYGLALDLWLRTNYHNAVLTLEGAAEYTDVRATHKGYPVSILTYNETEYEVYQKDASTSQWFYVDDDEEVAEDIATSADATFAEKYDKVVTGYHGENRVWEDWEQKLTAGLIDQDATTQGAGSCFVFYADTPAEQEKLMEMLSAFTIAFIDENGKELGTAKLNTQAAYINMGKITVPLEMETGVVYTDSDTREEHKGIVNLMQNVPTRITAIVYLNGRYLKNENVLASGELQGQLNIQFGTNASLKAPENEELMSQYRTITASVKVGDTTITNGIIAGSDGEGLPYRASGYTAQVDLTVKGEQPNSISGFFVREINSSQGTRGDAVTFTKNVTTDAEGNETVTWTANFTLKSPGTYVLNTLLVDGVQYNLNDGSGDASKANHPKVKIAGLNLESVTSTLRSGTTMTTESSVPVTVTAKIDTDLNLTNVTAHYSREDDTNQYNVVLSPGVDSNGNPVWTGTSKISLSGRYTLQYISVRGDTNQTLEVPAAAQTNSLLYLGVAPKIYSKLAEENRTILLKPGESVQIPMYVSVADDTGTAITNEHLKSVKLYYNLNDGVLPTADPLVMTWNGTFFEGILNVTAAYRGSLTFNHLSISEKADGTDPSSFYSIPDTPIFRIADYSPPEWSGVVAAPERQLAINPNTNGTASVKILNGDGARVWATFTRSKEIAGETLKPIELTPSSSATGTDYVTTFTFDLKEQVGTNQEVEGLWTLQKVYAEKTVEVEGQNTTKTFLLYDAAKTGEVLETRVIKTVNTKVFYNGEEYTAGHTITLEGKGFLETQTSGEVKVVAYDYTQNRISELSGAEWTFTHVTEKTINGELVNIQKQYSGYTDENGNYIKDTFGWTLMTMGEDADGTYASMTEDFIYGGEYEAQVKLKFEDTSSGAVHEFTVEKAKSPVFALKSIKPWACITKIDPSTQVNTQITHNNKTTPTFTAGTPLTGNISGDGFTATVYAKAEADNSGSAGALSNRAGNFTKPKLTITTYGVGSDYTVSMTLPAGDAKNSAVVFTDVGNKPIERTLGTTEVIKSFGLGSRHKLYAYYGHGENQRIEILTIKKGDREYKVVLDNALVITNPSSINQT